MPCEYPASRNHLCESSMIVGQKAQPMRATRMATAARVPLAFWMLLGLRAMVGVNVCNPDPRGKLDSAVHRLTETRVHAGVALKESEFGSDQVAEWYADPQNSST